MKLWSSSGRCLYEQKGSPLQSTRKHSHQSSEDNEEPAIITDALLCEETGCVAVVTYDHNIVLFGLEDLKLRKQVGFSTINIYAFFFIPLLYLSFLSLFFLTPMLNILLQILNFIIQHNYILSFLLTTEVCVVFGFRI